MIKIYYENGNTLIQKNNSIIKKIPDSEMPQIKTLNEMFKFLKTIIND
mgnify:CR=1 FL=1